MKKNLIYGILVAGITFGMIACDKKKDEGTNPGGGSPSSIKGTYNFKNANFKNYENGTLTFDTTITNPNDTNVAIPSKFVFTDSVLYITSIDGMDSSIYKYTNNKLEVREFNGTIYELIDDVSFTSTTMQFSGSESDTIEADIYKNDYLIKYNKQ